MPSVTGVRVAPVRFLYDTMFENRQLSYAKLNETPFRDACPQPWLLSSDGNL